MFDLLICAVNKLYTSCMKSGILRPEHVGLGDSVFFELFDDGRHPTSGSSGSDVGNQLDGLSFLHSRHRIGFLLTSKSSLRIFFTCLIHSFVSRRCKWEAQKFVAFMLRQSRV